MVGPLFQEITMRILSLRMLLGLAAAAAFPAVPAGAAPNPLAPAARILEALGRGMNAVAVKGKDAGAFAPLPAQAKRPLGPELKTAGVTSVRLVAMEFELVYFSGDKPAYYLRSALTLGKRGPSLVELRGREVQGGNLFVKPRPLADYKESAAPLAATAQALSKALSARDCAGKLPIATAAEFEFLPPKMAERATKDLERTRTGMPEECKKIAALKAARVELRVDDVAYAALGKDGKMVGMIKAGLEFVDGKLTVLYGKFRAAPPQR
jgi:hypothetical protein